MNALCLFGAISRKTSSWEGSATGKSNDLIDYELVANKYIIPNVIEPNKPIDVFIHCWTCCAETDMLRLYNPVSYKFEDNSKYLEKFKNKTSVIKRFAINRRSFLLSIKSVLSLLKQYEFDNNIEYDNIILYRPDVAVMKKLRLSNIQLIPGIDLVISNDGTKHHGDFHYIMSSKTANKFMLLYDMIDGNIDYDPITMPVTLAKQAGISMIQDHNMVAGKDQEVYRKM